MASRPDPASVLVIRTVHGPMKPEDMTREQLITALRNVALDAMAWRELATKRHAVVGGMADATKLHDPTFRSGDTATSERWGAIMENNPILGILIGIAISVPLWATLVCAVCRILR